MVEIEDGSVDAGDGDEFVDLGCEDEFVGVEDRRRIHGCERQKKARARLVGTFLVSPALEK